MSSDAATAVRPLRRDAAANQDRIVAAAREVFSERGVEVALSEVAKRAGVGLATVTRHFSRTSLVEAVLVNRTDEHLALLDDALQQPADMALAYYLEQLCARQVDDRSVCHALTLTLPDSPSVLEHRSQIRRRQQRLIDRARDAGTVREDVVPEDFVLIFQAVSGVIDTTRAAPDAWRRLLSVLLDGLAPRDAARSLPAAPTGDQLSEPLVAPRRGRRTGAIGR